MNNGDVEGSQGNINFLATLNLSSQFVDKNVSSGQMTAQHSVSMIGFTGGQGFLVFACKYNVCLKDDKSTSNCFIGRAAGRRLQAEERELQVFLHDTMCEGEPIPGSECSLISTSIVPGNEVVSTVPGNEVVSTFLGNAAATTSVPPSNLDAGDNHAGDENVSAANKVCELGAASLSLSILSLVLGLAHCRF